MKNRRMNSIVVCLSFIMTAVFGSVQTVYSAPVNPPETYQATTGYSSTSNTDGNLWTYEYVSVNSYANSTYVKFDYILKDYEDLWCIQNGSANNAMDWKYGRIGRNSMWPGYGEYDVSRTFNVAKNGIVEINAADIIRIWDGYTSEDGVNIAVYKNGVKIWPVSGQKLITNSSSLTFTPFTTAVKAGDKIHFRANKNIKETGDQIQWNPVVTYTNDAYNASFDMELTVREEIYNSSADYSFKTDENNGLPWKYQYVPSSKYANAEYVKFPWVYTEGNTGFWCVQQGTGINWSIGRIGVNTIYPAKNGENHLSRTFVVPHDGVVTIDANSVIGFTSSHGPQVTSGAEIAIYKNGTKIWPGGDIWQSLNKKRISLNFTSFDTSVKTGDEIHFRVRSCTDEEHAEVVWSPIISYISGTYDESLDKSIHPLPEPTIGKKYQASAGFATNSNSGLWTYEYISSGIYENISYTKFSSVWADEGYSYWCEKNGSDIDWKYGRIGATASYPGSDNYDLSRTFTAPYDGVVEISASDAVRIWMNYNSTDGVNIAIYKNGVKIFPKNKDWQLITNGSSLAEFPGFETAVKAGDKIHFRVNKNANNTDDQLQWNPVLTYTDDVYDSESDLELHPSGVIKDKYDFFDEFSSKLQGPEWYYFYAPASVNTISEYSQAYDWSGNWYWSSAVNDYSLGIMGKDVIQPGSTPVDAVLGFKAPVTGEITITMKDNGKINLPGNTESGRDGVNIKIQSNKGGAVSNVWPANPEWQHIGHEAGTNEYNFVPLTINVRKGEYLYFRVNRGENNWNDNLTMRPVITYNSQDLNDEGYNTDPGSIVRITDDPGVIEDLLPKFTDNFNRSNAVTAANLDAYITTDNNTLTIAPGVYKASGDRILNWFGEKSGKTIIADGVLIIVDDPTYRAANFEGMNNTTIQGLTIEYSSGTTEEPSHAIVIWSCNDLTLENFTILGGSGNGIQIGGNSDGVKIDGLTITESPDGNKVSSGIEIEYTVKNVSVINSVINNVESSGINISSAGTVINNIALSGATDGIRVLASDVSIKHITFDNITNYGVEVPKDIENTLVAKNIFNTVKLPLCFVKTFNTVAECNIFNGYTNEAIYDNGTKTLSIIDNEFNKESDYPISLGNTQIAVVNNNSYKNGENKAVNNREGTAVQIVGNEIPGAGLPEGVVGADESRLPQIDKQRFVNMPRKSKIDGKSAYEYIMAAYNSGFYSVIIPPGAYSIPETMPFINLKDFTIYAYGVLFEYTAMPVVTAFSYTNCTNVALKGLTIDYATVPNPQGTITAVENGKLIWTADAGYIQDLLTYGSIGSAECYKQGSDIPYADTGWSESEVTKISNGVYSLTSKSNLGVGSKVIFRGKFAHVNTFTGCTDMAYEDGTVFGGTGFGFVESNGGGNSKLNRVAFTPGPKPNGATAERLISTCDATHAVNMREGMKVTNCLFEKMTDDATNNCGTYGTVSMVTGNGNTLTYSGDLSFKINDRALIYLKEGKLLCDAVVTDVNGKTITLNKALEGFVANVTIIENASSNGNNFMYDNCLVQNNRSRGFLIKSPYGTITNCTLKDNGMSGILISPEIADNWGECGFSWDITITNNRFIDGGFFTGSDLHSPINITGDNFPKNDSAYYNHGNILIENNSFEGRYTKYCINANSVNGLKILGNTFGLTNTNASNTISSLKNTQPLVNVQGAQNIEVSDNIYIAGNEIGSRVNIGEYVKQIYGNDIGIIAGDYIEAELMQYYDSSLNKWQIKVVLKNVATDNKSYSGEVTVVSPANITTPNSKNYSAINRGDSTEIYFNVDLTKIQGTSADVKIEYTLSNGGKGTLTKSMSFLSADFTDTDINIDGTLNDTAWNKTTEIDLGKNNIISASGKLTWNDTYFYLSAVVNDDIHSQTKTNSADIWNGDSIQLGISIKGGYIETGFALGDNGTIYQHCWQYKDAAGQRDNQKEIVLTNDNTVSKIIRDENSKTTIYEIAVKWSFFGVDGSDIKDNDNISIGLLINNSNGAKDDRTWLSYFADSIVSGSKEVKYLGILTLGRAVSVPDVTADISVINGVTVPATGAVPVSEITETEQYTGTITWSPNDNPFKANIVYTATITLTPKDGYTLAGLSSDFFTITGASSVTYDEASGVVTAVFPATTQQNNNNSVSNSGIGFNSAATTAGTTQTYTESGTTTINPTTKPAKQTSTEIKESETPKEETPFVMAFTDVKKTDWFYSDIEFITSLGLMNGTRDNAFSPNISMLRGMFVTVLGRYFDADTSKYKETTFDDVDKSKYYAAYIEWAKDKKIVNGIGSGKFGPEVAITRQDIAVLLMRVAELTGKTLPEVREYTGFSDEDEIADYAIEAVKTLYRAGIINGRPDSTFASRAMATRGEVAAMLHRFIEALK